MVPGNYPAARRYARGRKPPKLLLGSICTLACILFMGSAALLAVGYLNPFGTIGLSILGVGAVLYFGTILFLVLSCLQVQRKYPGMQPISFRIPTRRPGRPPPATMPNVSGQMPIHTIANYRIHNDLPPSIKDFKAVPEKPRNVPMKANNNAEETNSSNSQNQTGRDDPDASVDLESGDNSADRSTQDQASHQDTGHHGDLGVDSSIHVPFEGETRTDYQEQQNDVKVDAEKYSKGREHAQNGATVQSADSGPELHGNQDKQELSLTALQKRDSKGNRKTHHVEVPFDDYPSSDSSLSVSSKKQDTPDRAPESKGKQKNTPAAQSEIRTESLPPQKKTSEHLSPGQTQGQVIYKKEQNSATSNSPSEMEKHKGKVHKENQSDGLIKSNRIDRKTMTQSSPQTERKTQSSHQEKFPGRKTRTPQWNEINQDASKTESLSKPVGSSSPASPVLVRRHEPATQKMSMSPPTDRKATMQHTQDQTLLRTPQSQDGNTGPNPSPIIQKKLLQLQNRQSKSNVLGESQNLQEFYSPDSSPRNKSKHAVVFVGETIKTSQYPSTDLPSSNSRVQVSSPVYGLQNTRGHSSVLTSSPPIDRKHDTKDINDKVRANSTAPGILHTSPKKRTNKEQSHRDDRKTVSPTRTRELIQEHRVRYSQDVASSGSPPSSRKAASSSPPRHRQRSPDIPHTITRTQDSTQMPNVIPTKSRSDDSDRIHGKKYIHQSASSSQSSDNRSSPASSPLTAKKLLHYKKEKTHQGSTTGSRAHSSDSESSEPRRRNQQQESHQSLDKNQRSPRSRETSPAAAKASPPSNKTSPSHHRKDQL